MQSLSNQVHQLDAEKVDNDKIDEFYKIQSNKTILILQEGLLQLINSVNAP